ncbi:hypothetical protein CAJAP_05086 [Camponotus japonicus]
MNPSNDDDGETKVTPSPSPRHSCKETSSCFRRSSWLVSRSWNGWRETDSDFRTISLVQQHPVDRRMRGRQFPWKPGSSCCGRRYSTSEPARPDYNYNKVPLEIGHYSSQYNERNPVDRFGWQTQSRPSGSAGSGGRPGGGEGGSGTYAGNLSGDRYPSRPVYGSESANRPSALGYGNAGGYNYGVSSHGGYGGRPSGYGGSNGGYGISGTLADGDEFGPGDSAYPDGSVPQHPGNFHAQKAVALKALAGVALIGAAAALASNPVLLPIGIVGGRKKRSEAFSEEMQHDHQSDDQMDYILNMLRRNLYKIQKNSSTNRLIVSPRCVARLTCEIQKDYLSEIDKDVEFLNTQNRKYHLTNLIRNNVLNAASVNSNVKDLIKMAIDVATENRNCNMFACSYVRKG